MNTSTRLLVFAAFIPLAMATAPAWSKGGKVATKVVGWSLNPGSGSGSSSKSKGGGVLGGSSGPGTPGTGMMSGMLMTPNGMIAQNTPSMAAGNADNMAGSTMVAHQTRGVGNSMVDTPARGIGNSQGSGGTLDIAQMAHFGGTSLSSLGSMLGAGSAISSLLSSSSARSKPAGSGAPAGRTGGTHNAVKSPAMGMPANAACVSANGSKAGCG